MAEIKDIETSLLHNGKIENWDSKDTWNDVADLYDLAIGRATLNGAVRLVELANEHLSFEINNEKANLGKPAPSSISRKVIDLGAGTGSVALTLTERYPNLEILATDISAGMLSQLTKKWQQRATNTTSPNSSHIPIRTQVADMSAPLSSEASNPGYTGVALTRSLAGTFSHTLSMAAVQATSDNLGCLKNMWDLLAPGGCCAVGNWDFENECAVHDVWALASTAADPTYRVPPIMPPGRWSGMAELEAGMAQVGFVNLRKEIVKCKMPVDDGSEGFIRWYFRSKNPAAAERLSTFHGDRDVLEREMRRVLDEKYDRGTRLIMDVDVVVGTKPV